MGRIKLENIAIVLSQPHFPENIGAAARAMRNMGLMRLVVVAPENFDLTKVRRMATHAALDVVEQMGNEMIVYFEVKNKTFLGRLDPRTSAKVGMSMNASFNMANMQLFDTETDEALWLPEHMR